MGERKSLKNTGEGLAGNLEIVKAKALHAAGKTGIVASGTFERVETTADGKYKGSKSYFVRNEADDTLYIINGTTVLNQQMAQLDPNDKVNVEIVFIGQGTSKSGTNFYDWEVFTR